MKVTVATNGVPQVEEKLGETVEMTKDEKVNVEIQEPDQEQKCLEEYVDKELEISQEEKDIPMLEETVVKEDMTTERLEKGTAREAEAEVANQQAVGEGKVEETHVDSPKKSRQITKQNHKMKVTVPKPFSLETEKRMSRERRGSMDFNDSKLTLLKSSSLNYKNMSQSYLGPERSSDLRGSVSSAPKKGLKLKVTTDEKINKLVVDGSSRKEKANVKEVEKKTPPVAVKKQDGNEPGKSKLQKNSTFKALPLPSFYHQKDSPPKIETKKIRVTHSKPPPVGELKKIVPKSDNKKIEEKGKKISQKIGTSAKETISKLFRTTRNSLGTPKEKVKEVVSSA